MGLLRVEGTIEVDNEGQWDFQTGMLTETIMVKDTIEEVLSQGADLFRKIPGRHHFIITLETWQAKPKKL